MQRRHVRQSRFDLEQEHQPMTLALVAVLADQAGEVQIGNCQGQPQFLLRLAARAGVRRFALVLMQLSSAGTPKSEIRFLRQNGI